jgi:hypothetical protein
VVMKCVIDFLNFKLVPICGFFLENQFKFVNWNLWEISGDHTFESVVYNDYELTSSRDPIWGIRTTPNNESIPLDALTSVEIFGYSSKPIYFH